MVDLCCDFVKDFFQSFAYICRQAIPEFGIGHQHIAKVTIIGFRNVLLDLEEFLRIDVRPGVFGTIHYTGFQCLIDFSESQLLREGANGFELGFEDIGGLNSELQPLGIFGLA